MTYGVGYVGSKNTIAADIVNILPKGKRQELKQDDIRSWLRWQ